MKSSALSKRTIVRKIVAAIQRCTTAAHCKSHVLHEQCVLQLYGLSSFAHQLRASSLRSAFAIASVPACECGACAGDSNASSCHVLANMRFKTYQYMPVHPSYLFKARIKARQFKRLKPLKVDCGSGAVACTELLRRHECTGSGTSFAGHRVDIKPRTWRNITAASVEVAKLGCQWCLIGLVIGLVIIGLRAGPCKILVKGTLHNFTRCRRPDTRSPAVCASERAFLVSDQPCRCSTAS